MYRKRRSVSGSHDHMKKLCNSEHLIGQLTARSHILNTDPQSILLEICSEESVRHIVVDNLSIFLPKDNIVIGQCYRFSDLLPCSLLVKSNIKCYRMRDITSWHQVPSLNKIIHLPALEQLKTIKGTVTKVDHKFGICYLNHTSTLIVSTCAMVALVHMPTVGQRVTVYNAHHVGNQKNGFALYAMCVKSFMEISSEEEATKANVVPTLNVSPLMLSLGDKLRGYKIILWLQDCSVSLRKSFPDEFLTSKGISLSDCDDFRSHLLQNIAKCVLKRSDLQKESTVVEFMACDHNSHCGALHQEFSCCSLCQLDEELDVETELDDDVSDEFWQYSITKVDHRFLTGVLSFKHGNHRLNLYDDSSNILTPCLILSRNEQTVQSQELALLCNKVVIVWEHNIVKEKFSDPNNTLRSLPHYKFLAVYDDNLDILSPLTKDWRNWRNDEEKHAMSNNGTLNISQMKASPLENYVSQLVLVQTKSSLTFQSSLKTVRCSLLVSLIGEMIPIKNSSSSDLASKFNNKNTKSRIIFLVFEHWLLGATPWMSVNSLYEIRLPLSCDINLFSKGSSVESMFGKLALKLPATQCVTLPPGCEIHFVRNNFLPTVNLRNRDCFGVNRSLEEAAFKELIDVVGFIVKRDYQDPRWDREKVDLKANGFGIPGPKVIVLILRDSPEEHQTGLPITLYLTNWSTLQYPCALVPGAKVIFRFVMKIKPSESSQTTSPYLRGSVLTSAEVLELSEQTTDIAKDAEKKKEVWGARSLLCHIVSNESPNYKWISVSMVQLHRVTLTAKCSFCSYPFAGVCTFRGCSAPSNSIIYSQASFMISEFGSPTAMVFVPDAHVKSLLQVSEKTWKMITLLVQTYGQLEYYQYSTSEINNLSIEQRIFRSFCMVSLQGRTFHLLCRRFNRTKQMPYSEKFSGLSFLYAVDIAPVSKQLAASNGCDPK